MRLRCVPATREVFLDDDGLSVVSISQRTRAQSDWTQAPIPLPDGLEATGLHLHAARATEWNTDLLVELTCPPAVEVWRLSPRRIRARQPLAGVEVPASLDGVRATELGFEYPQLGHKKITVAITELPFDVEVSVEYSSPFELDFFISYRSTQIRLAEVLKQRLQSAGMRVWFDKDYLKVGNFKERIERGVACSDAFVVLWSDGSGTDKSNAGMGTLMSQAREIGIIIERLRHRTDIPHATDSLALYSVDGRMPAAELIDDCYQVAQAADYSIEEFADVVVDWYRSRVKRGYR